MVLPRSPVLRHDALSPEVFGPLAVHLCARRVSLSRLVATLIVVLVSATPSNHGIRRHPSVPPLLLLSSILLIHHAESLHCLDFRAMFCYSLRSLPAPPAGPWWVAQCRPFQHLVDLKRVMGSRSNQTVHTMS